MPRENIISGGLEGDGIEGHKKRVAGKPSSSESPEYDDHNEEDGDPFDTGFGSAKQEGKVPAKNSGNITKDIFETDFGSARSKKGYDESSSIGSDSDIFSNGFGSEDAGWMSGKGKKSVEKQQVSRPDTKKEHLPERKETGDIFETDIASHPLDTGDEKAAAVVADTDKKKEDTDPLYTGFGYTNQRNPESSLPRSPVKSATEKVASPKKTDEKKVKKIFDEDYDDDLFS